MNSYIELAIALILVVLIFSVIAYIIQELIAANLEFRGKMLKSSLQQMLDGSSVVNTVVQKIYTHPQIKKLQQDLKKLPSYVPSSNFALAVIDEVAKAAPTVTGNLYNDFRDGIASFAATNGDLKILLQNYFQTSTNLQTLRDSVEKWYNDYMDRVTGWYKKNTRITLRIIAVIITLCFNVNLIFISKAIHNNTGLKASQINSANKLVDDPEPIKNLYTQSINSSLQKINDSYKHNLVIADSLHDTARADSIRLLIQKKQDEVFQHYTRNRIADIDTLLGKISNPELPVGWSKASFSEFKADPLWGVLGLFLGAAAISMGAPFWFQILVKLVNIRRAGIKPEDSDSKRS